MPSAPLAKAVVADTAARDIVVETDAYIATFNTQGAVLKSYRLRHYSDAKGEPLELIPADLPAGTFARPFTIATDNESGVGDAGDGAVPSRARTRCRWDRIPAR